MTSRLAIVFPSLTVGLPSCLRCSVQRVRRIIVNANAAGPWHGRLRKFRGTSTPYCNGSAATAPFNAMEYSVLYGRIPDLASLARGGAEDDCFASSQTSAQPPVSSVH